MTGIKNEFAGQLRARGGRIHELTMLPGTLQGRSSALVNLWMLPVDFTVVGSVHSHPSGNYWPSDQDIEFFNKFGRVHIIVGAPFSARSWRARSRLRRRRSGRSPPAGGGEAAHGGGHGITPEKVTDFIWRTVNFLVFAAILLKLVTKPAKAFFAQRSTDIGETFETLEARKAEAEAALRAAEARLAEVGAERERLIEQFKAEGEAEKAKIIAKAEQAAQRLKDMAAMTIAAETKKAAADLKQEIVEAAVQLAEQIVREKIVPEDQQRLVDDYLAKVVEAH